MCCLSTVFGEVPLFDPLAEEIASFMPGMDVSWLNVLVAFDLELACRSPLYTAIQAGLSNVQCAVKLRHVHEITVTLL